MKNPTNPLDLIKNDHEKVQKLFEDYRGMDSGGKKDQAKKLCLNLAVHMAMEEELFYPKIERISDLAADMMGEARKEHDEARGHIKAIENSGNEEEMDEHVQMMKKGVMQHIQEEEGKIFPIAKENLEDDFTKLTAGIIAFKAKSKGEAILEKIKSMF